MKTFVIYLTLDNQKSFYFRCLEGEINAQHKPYDLAKLPFM